MTSPALQIEPPKPLVALLEAELSKTELVQSLGTFAKDVRRAHFDRGLYDPLSDFLSRPQVR